MARLGNVAMVGIVMVRRVGLPLQGVGRERLGDRSFGLAGCW